MPTGWRYSPINALYLRYAHYKVWFFQTRGVFKNGVWLYNSLKLIFKEENEGANSKQQLKNKQLSAKIRENGPKYEIYNKEVNDEGQNSEEIDENDSAKNFLLEQIK